MQRSRFVVRHRVLVSLLALVATLASLVGAPSVVGAQYYDVYSNAPYKELAGLEQAIQRLYQGESELNIYADIARFDTEANAAVGLGTLNAYYLDAYATAGSPIAFEPVEIESSLPGALAYHALLALSGQDPYADMALVQAQDGLYVYSVFVSNYAYDSNPVEFAIEVAAAMLEAMAAAPDGLGTPEAEVDGAMTGGAWTTFPRLGDEVLAPYTFTYSEDTEWYVLMTEVSTPEASLADPADTLYGDVGGLESVISRSYAATGDVPQDAYVELAAFADEASAETGFGNAEMALLDEIETAGFDLETAEADVSSDASAAWIGQIEDVEGSVAVVLARSGSYVVTVLVSRAGAEDTLGLATGLAQAVIDAEAGEGEGTFSRFGDSAGGLWDRLPAAGDDVLQGLEPYDDVQVFP